MLLPEIDEKETIKRVRRFFKEDYPRLCRQAGRDQSAIKAVVYTGMPKASGTDNSKENSITATLWAQELLHSVYESVKRCDHDSRVILAERYGTSKPSWQIAQQLGYENTRFHEKQKHAFLEFADAFETTGRNAFDDPQKSDLHVYKKD